MKSLLFIALLLMLTSPNFAEDRKEYEKNGEVLILTNENFDQAIKDHKALFVKFYTDWCPHCKKLKPKWKKLADYLKKNGHNVKIAMIDAEKHPEIAKKHRVNFSFFFVHKKFSKNKIILY